MKDERWDIMKWYIDGIKSVNRDFFSGWGWGFQLGFEFVWEGLGVIGCIFQ